MPTSEKTNSNISHYRAHSSVDHESFDLQTLSFSQIWRDMKRLPRLLLHLIGRNR